MKFACPVLDSSLRARIADQTRLRFDVIDRFVSEHFGSIWLQRSRLIGGETNERPRRDLWEFALQSNLLLRLYKAGRLKSDYRAVLSDLTVHGFRFSSDLYKLWFLGASYAVIDDLASAWHPEFHGRSISPECADFEVAWQRTRKALELLAPYPVFTDLVCDEIGAICFISANPDMEEGQCISLTSKMVPGLVYVSPAPAILLAESLVHESAHLRFRSIEEVTELYAEGSDSRVKTPLRADPRPISGLMHQLVVLRYLSSLYENLCASDDKVIARQRPQVEKRFQVHLQDLDAGKRIAKDVKSALSPAGQKILDRLLEDSESILL